LDAWGDGDGGRRSRTSACVTETTAQTDLATESPCVLMDDDARPVDPVVLEV